MEDLRYTVTSAMEKTAEKESREERVVSTRESNGDGEFENVLRPKTMEGYVGQERVKDNLAVSIASAKMRGEPLDHVLLYGPPGLGKTTLAHIIAAELGGTIKVVSAPALDRGVDLVTILNSLLDGDVLFIDEIHRLKHEVAEILYSAMEDFCLDLPNGKGMGATVIHCPVARFTLVGATTKIGLLPSPLRDRFGIVLRLETYSTDELAEIVSRSAEKLGVVLEASACGEIACRSRGTPRIANRLLKRVRDYSVVKRHDVVSLADAKNCLKMLEIDELGLDYIDQKLMEALATKLAGGPCGLTTIAAAINEDVTTIEDVYEPYLLQLGFLARTPRGRILLPKGYAHLGLTAPTDKKGTTDEDE